MNPALKPASRRTAFRRARGSAMVEFVLLNIVLIPLFLYAIFLMDAAYLKLDLQETVVSGLWDFSQLNTEAPSWGGIGDLSAPQNRDKNNLNELQSAMRAVRVVYADHTSAFDDGAEPGRDGYGEQSYLTGNGAGGEHDKHHTGFGAHYSFRFKNGPDTQFLCSISSDMSWNPDPNMRSFASSGYNAGGEVRCEATGFIYNYIIPETFLQEFSKVKVTQMKRRENTTADGVHEWQGEGGNASNIVALERGGISFNTWALRNGAKNSHNDTQDEDSNTQLAPTYDGALSDADVRVPGSMVPLIQTQGSAEANPFFRRVQYIYARNGTALGSYADVKSSAEDLADEGDGEKILKVTNTNLGTRTNDKLPNIIGVHLTARYKPAEPGQTQSTPGLGTFFGKKYLGTPYEGPNDDYKAAADARGAFYLGCQSQETPDCF
ncbi:hypothetical protein [Hyalangium sp.]|uniref:TadE/TadG family type IV pilus assembly protein n=1 Tax=Hyalangium sp. TaxID=2028555 RepID=UPI002D426E34|nr:hypothetical protein [Hyalangium sp.]HYH94533.1 hypothetical protein [Hyalangium sp.]